MIPVYKPYLPEISKKYARQALDDGWLSFHKFNDIVEERLSEILGVKHVILTNNGTTATHLVAKGLKFKHPEIRSVLSPNHCYVAAWNAFLYDKDHFISVIPTDIDTWNGRFSDHTEHKDQVALVVVHNLGNPVNVPALKRQGFVVVEDACEAFFGEYEGKAAGTEGLVSSLSFFGNKNITSGEGGAVTTSDDDIAEYLKKLRGQGQSSVRYVHDVLGYNYRMTNIQAAILNGQLDCIDEIKERKSIIWEGYTSAFENVEGIELQKVEAGCKHSQWMFGIRVTGRDESFEDKQKIFNSRGVDIRPMFYPSTYHKHLLTEQLSHHKDKFSDKAKEIIILPSYPELQRHEQNLVINTVIDFLNRKI